VIQGKAAESAGDERTWLKRADHTASRDFDRAVMTLAAGALGLSIAFIQNIAPHPVHKVWLALSWSLFASSLVLILSSLLTSQHALRCEMRYLDSSEEDAGMPGGWLGHLTTQLNWFAAGAFVLGVGALVVFAFLNL
jgi:hypothetical protein